MAALVPRPRLNLTRFHRQRQVVAMPRSAIDLKIDNAIVEMTEVNAQTAIGIGASELFSGVSIGVEQTHHSALGGLPVGKLTAEFQVAIEVLQGAFDLVCPSRQSLQAAEEKQGRQKPVHEAMQ